MWQQLFFLFYLHIYRIQITTYLKESSFCVWIILYSFLASVFGKLIYLFADPNIDQAVVDSQYVPIALGVSEQVDKSNKY